MQVLSGAQDLQVLIKKAVAALRNGGMIIYPTETCYGIGVDATNKLAVEKLIKYKGDRKNKPISVAVCDKAMAKDYVEFNPAAENLFDNFLPGPITVVCQGKHRVDSRLESEKGTLGIRFPKHDLSLKIIRTFDKPITSTSANVSNGKTPYKISDILDDIPESKKKLIDLIIDVGSLPYHPPSTIVDTTLNTPQVLRQGEFIFDGVNVEIFITHNVEETISFARKFLISNFLPRRQAGEFLNNVKNQKCLIFALQGELGVGKTQFAKGIAKGLNIKDNIKSPTFILCSEYPFSLRTTGYVLRTGTLFHIDTWRMQNESELADIGFKEMIMPGNVIVIEWGQKVFEILKKIEKRKDIKVVWVEIETVGENIRRIIVK